MTMDRTAIKGNLLNVLAVTRADHEGNFLRIVIEDPNGHQTESFLDRTSAMLLYAGIRDHSKPFQSPNEGGTFASLGEKPSTSSCLPS